MKNLIFIFIVGLFCLSCGKTQTEINGEIFLKDGDQTKKLSAVTVKIIKKEKFKNSDKISMTDADYFATTDADGKFSVKVPKGEYVAAVDFTKEDYFTIDYQWRIPFIANDGTKLILNNSNATGKLIKNE